MKTSTVVIFMGLILIVSIMFLWSRSPQYAARDGKVILQGMLTKGKAVKGRGGERMIGNYFERTVNLEVID
jgi:hypothetical protein